MRILSILLLFLIVPIICYADSTIPKPLVSYKIIYKSSKVSGMYLLWTMNNWKVPEEKYRPAGTIIKDGMAYTKMAAHMDSFFIDLKLPGDTYIDCMFKGIKDSAGIIKEGWDDHWGENYNIYISGKKDSIVIADNTFFFSEPNLEVKAFHILKEGKTLLYISLSLFFSVILIASLKRKRFFFRFFRKDTLLPSLIVSGFILMILIRLDMNGHFFEKTYLLFGASLYDFLFMASFSAVVYLLLYAVSKFPLLKKLLSVIIFLIIIAILIFSLLNIEIVNQLGKPVTYSWLYYSDFLQATDAKNALKSNFTPGLISNISFLLLAVLIIACSIGHLLYEFNKQYRRMVIFTAIVFTAFAATGFIQVKRNHFEEPRIVNPVYVLASSWVNSEKKTGLFSMPVSDRSKHQVLQMHLQPVNESIAITGISNIILFIMESTPANLVQIYDSTYRVTPHLNDWKKHAIVYNNIYSHLPNTVNAVFSLNCGVYPMINYKAIISEHPNVAIQSLPQLLKERGWSTSLFFSSDLQYGNIGDFVKGHGIETAEDLKTIACNYGKFQSNYAQLEGLDDRCIVSGYFSWRDTLQQKKTFSILWTNQTHYPYFSHDTVRYTDNKALNSYLNALKNVDDAFEKLMQGLIQRKEPENTLVVVIGDHGEAFGTHKQLGHASKIYEENIQVPCLFINPVLFNGQQDNRVGGLVDIPSTILHLLNINVPAEWQGISLLGKKQKDHTFFIGPFSDFIFGSRFDNYKFIYNATANTYELYDLAADPGELNNIAESHKDIVKSEYDILAAWVQYHTAKMKVLINSTR